MEKTYDPQQHEQDLYQRWEASGFFNPDNLSGEPYAIVIPPPNVTGILHLGHALENALMDTMARYQRMLGKKVLLLPGTDHAPVATQARVEKMLLEEQGIERPRETLGREKLVETIRQFADASQATILNQVRRLGTGADWSRLAYTFDEARSTAVNEIFFRMYNDGLIYRGYRAVNWSVKGQTTCSDDELEHIERPAKLYTFRYSQDFPIAIATTRPETKLGDTAVAVHPDGKYKQYIGQTFTVDVGAAQPLQIKVIGRPEVDESFGTGAVGVTPAHSQTDFAMYEEQKAAGQPIELIAVIGADGTMTSQAGAAYAGLPVEEARVKFVQWLRGNDLLEAEEDITQNVGTSDRFKDVVEVIPMTQWWINVNAEIPGRGVSLKDLMRQAVTSGLQGDADKKITIVPEREQKKYLRWIDNLRDWCISRQIWWGHRLPVWYNGEAVHVGLTPPAGEDGWQQDEDTLDTWFSSALWTFSTLGWPEQTDDLKTFHPTAWMQMGTEIVFFWMARMILMTSYALDTVPFKQAHIHGILRDEAGKKFSKSDGNGFDPLEMIDQYGTDALRLSVMSGITPGNDGRFYTDKVEGTRNLVNKLWNISRYIITSTDTFQFVDTPPAPQTAADSWVLSRLADTITTVNEHLGRDDFSAAVETLRAFTWSELADWYIEVAKVEGGKEAMLAYLLSTVLRLWHPFAPFVTEAIWQQVNGQDNFIMVAPWPAAPVVETDDAFTPVQDLITAVRTIRATYNVPPATLVRAVVVTQSPELFTTAQAVIERLARVENIELVAEKPAVGVVATVVTDQAEVYIPLEGVIDIAAEQQRLDKEIANLQQYVTGGQKKLANQEFVSNAPAEVVAAEKEKIATAAEKLAALQQQRQQLG